MLYNFYIQIKLRNLFSRLMGLKKILYYIIYYPIGKNEISDIPTECDTFRYTIN